MGAQPKGKPGCPDFALSIASAEMTLIALMVVFCTFIKQYSFFIHFIIIPILLGFFKSFKDIFLINFSVLILTRERKCVILILIKYKRAVRRKETTFNREERSPQWFCSATPVTVGTFYPLALLKNGKEVGDMRSVYVKTL
jgi:hypothetical protein